jgi:transposase
MLAALSLTNEEIRTLDACSLHGPHPRQRRRALAVLGHHRGHSIGQLAHLFAVRYATVHSWLHAWQDRGLAGLAEGRRVGRPAQVVEAAKKK